MEPKVKNYLKGTQYAELKERQYLGVGYHHQFKNEQTGEFVYVQCTEEEYQELGEKNIQPVLDGHIWVGSTGGTYKVDTPDGRLQESEFCETPDQVIVRLNNKSDGYDWKIAEKADLQVNTKLDQVWR